MAAPGRSSRIKIEVGADLFPVCASRPARGWKACDNAHPCGDRTASKGPIDRMSQNAPLQQTILNATHRALGAKMVDFGGWDMPIHYGSQLDEHHLVRRDAGMFDVSHMTVVDLHGVRVREFLRHLVANSVDKLKVSGKALYTCMLNPRGGVIDDLIIYYRDEAFFRLVVNASTRDKDLAWITEQAKAFDVAVTERPDFAMIAVQGPNARDKNLGLLS